MRPYVDLDRIEETDYYQSCDDSGYEFYRLCEKTVQVYYLGNKIGSLNINRAEGPLKKHGDNYLKLCGIVDSFFKNHLQGAL